MYLFKKYIVFTIFTSYQTYKSKQALSSIYTLNRCLLKKKPASHSILGPSGLIFATKYKDRNFANSLENQFTLNPDLALSKMSANIQKLKNIEIDNSTIYATPGTIQKMINNFSKKKALTIVILYLCSTFYFT